MAISHALPGQAFKVLPLADRLGEHQTSAIFKSQDLEVIRLVLPAGGSLRPHKVPGEVTIHCLEGCFDIALEASTVRLEAGELLLLARNALHGVQAVVDASALVTIALRH